MPSQLSSPREVGAVSPTFGRSTFGSEARFSAAAASLVRASWAPGPAAYTVVNNIGQPTADSLHANARVIGFGKAPALGAKTQLNLIKIAAEDRDKPVAEALKNTLARNAGRVIDLFRDWDSDGNGMLDKGEFRDALRRMELYVEDTAADEIFDGWDLKGEGELSLQQMQSILKRSSGSIPAAIKKNKEQLEAQRAFEEERKAQKLAARMKHAVSLKMRKPSAAQEGVLSELAERFDKNPTVFSDWMDKHNDAKGFISRPAFRRLMRSLNVPGEVEDINAFFDMFDPLNEGTIEASRLEASLRWVHKSRRTTLVRGKEMVFRSEKQFHERVGEAFKANAGRILDLFHEVDTNGDGVLSRAEFKRALPVLGLMIEQAEADKLFDWFDDDASGEITFDEFYRIIKNDQKKKDDGPVIVEESWANLANLRADVMETYTRLKLPSKEERDKERERDL